MDNIKLNFVNRSSDVNNSNIVIFQKNDATNFDETPVAWHVIENVGVGDNHPFEFPMQYEVAVMDSWGNYTPPMSAQIGQRFDVARSASGDTLSHTGSASVQDTLEVRNDLAQGAVSAHVYKGDKLLASKSSIAPGQRAVFEFKPSLWIGVAPQIQEGQSLNSAVLSDINTELPLLGVASADIVMTGGGPGKSSSPFAFTLENVVRT